MCFSVTIALPSFEEYLLNTDAAGSAPPDAFGPFRVLHQIGAGALGPVFRAYQPEQDRLVAVKLFRLDLPPERTHQLVAELEKVIAADLAHPGIATPLAAGISDVSAYLAMDFVAADSLDIVVRDEAPASASDVVRVATQLGSALDLAAAIGITHGALHPRDVLISADDVRMTGLGVAYALELAGFSGPIRRPYTAPERAAGGGWDRRADVFGLAALVFELMCRRRIGGPGDQAADSIDDVPGANVDALRKAFSRALAENPGDRFSTAGDFARAVQAAFEKKRSGVGRAPSNGRTANAEPRSAPDALDPVPANELPLLTDAMLSAERSPVEDLLPPPAGGLPHDAVDLPLVAHHLQPSRADDPPISRAARSPNGVRRRATEESLPDYDGLTLAADDLRQDVKEPGFDIPEAVAHDPGDVPVRSFLTERADSADRSPTSVWPLMLALVVGIALGFGMAMLLLSRDRVPPQPQQASVGPAARPPVEIRDEPIREFTDRAVVGQPAAPEPAGPPAAAATSDPLTAAPPGAAVNPAPAKPAPAQVPATTTSAATKPTTAKSVAPKPVAAKPVAARPAAARPAAKPTVARTQTGRAGASTTAPRATTRAAAKPAPTVPARTGPGVLVVESRPAGAKVFVDGKLMGNTPLVVQTLGAGEHALHLDIDGYHRWATSVRIVTGERSRVAASLER
jgi:serine/threonine protein kinase